MKIKDIFENLYVKHCFFNQKNANNGFLQLDNDKVLVYKHHNCYFLQKGYFQLYEFMTKEKDVRVLVLKLNEIKDLAEYEEIRKIPLKKSDNEKGYC